MAMVGLCSGINSLYKCVDDSSYDEKEDYEARSSDPYHCTETHHINTVINKMFLVALVWAVNRFCVH